MHARSCTNRSAAANKVVAYTLRHPAILPPEQRGKVDATVILS